MYPQSIVEKSITATRWDFKQTRTSESNEISSEITVQSLS